MRYPSWDTATHVVLSGRDLGSRDARPRWGSRFPGVAPTEGQ